MRYLRRPWTLLLAVAITGAGCIDESVGGPSSFGRLAAIVTDSAAGATFTGSVAGNMLVSISADAATWIDLGASNAVSMDLQSNADTISVHGVVSVPVGSYSYVRLTLRDMAAVIDSGAAFEDTTLFEAKTMALGGEDSQAGIILPVGFSIFSDATRLTTVEFRLNSDLWVTGATVFGGVVDDELLDLSATSRTQ